MSNDTRRRYAAIWVGVVATSTVLLAGCGEKAAEQTPPVAGGNQAPPYTQAQQSQAEAQQRARAAAQGQAMQQSQQQQGGR